VFAWDVWYALNTDCDVRFPRVLWAAAAAICVCLRMQPGFFQTCSEPQALLESECRFFNMYSEPYWNM
jgi:hypothetical protein